MVSWKKNVGADALRARRKVEEQDQRLRRYGLICLYCGQKKRYNEFPINRRSGRVSPSRPCLSCNAKPEFQQPPEPTPRERLIRQCPACSELRTENHFDASGLCMHCIDEEQSISARLNNKRCPVCQQGKRPTDFTVEGNCTACAAFLAVHTCQLCHKGLQESEMVRENTVCVYCAFGRGSQQDLVALRSLVRTDRVAAAKIRDFIDHIPQKLAT